MPVPALYFLTIESGVVVLRRNDFVMRVNSKREVDEYLATFTRDSGRETAVSLSSTMDFPEEFTRDSGVIALAKSFWEEEK